VIFKLLLWPLQDLKLGKRVRQQVARLLGKAQVGADDFESGRGAYGARGETLDEQTTYH